MSSNMRHTIAAAIIGVIAFYVLDYFGFYGDLNKPAIQVVTVEDFTTELNRDMDPIDFNFTNATYDSVDVTPISGTTFWSRDSFKTRTTLKSSTGFNTRFYLKSGVEGSKVRIVSYKYSSKK